MRVSHRETFIVADQLACALRRAQDGLIVPLATTAAAFVRIEGWRPIGYERQSDYVREQLDRTSRWLYDLATLHRAMETYPSLRKALLGHDGKPALGAMAALAVARVATPETVDRWIERARSESVRDLVDDVRRFRAQLGRGSTPHSSEVPAPGAAPDSSDPDIDLHDADGDDGENGERCLVRIPAADFVVGVFDELRDLFGAVNGRDAGPTAAIEACLAESASSGVLPVVIEPGALPHLPEGMTIQPLRVGTEDAVKERALARATNCWEKLKSWDSVSIDPQHEPKEWDGVRLRQAAKDLLLRVFEAGLSAGLGKPLELHHQLGRLVALEDEVERHLTDHLAYMSRRRAWRELGFASLAHYAIERLGMRRSTAIKRSMVAAALRGHPKMRKAYRAGVLGQEKALLMHRILVRGAVSTEIEAAWVRWGAIVTVKRLRDEVRRLERNKLDALAGPPKIQPWDIERAKLIRLQAVACEDSRDAARDRRRKTTEANTDPPVDGGEGDARHASESARVDVQSILAAARAAAAAWDPFQDGGASASQCLGPVPTPATEPLLPISDQAWIESIYRAPGMGIERLERWSNYYLERHTNDALPRPTVFIDLRLRRELAHDLVSSIQAWHGRVTAAALWLDLEAPKKPFDAPTVLSMTAVKTAHLFTERSRRPPAWIGFLALLENALRSWDDPCLHEKRAAEGTYRKAGWRCMAPGCTARADLQNHHIAFGSGKRLDAPWNLVCLCRGHHQYGIHGGLASVTGRAPFELLFRIGRPELGAYYINEQRVVLPGTPPQRALVGV